MSILAFLMAAALAGAQDKPGLLPPGLTPPGQEKKKPGIVVKAVRPAQKAAKVGETIKVSFDLSVPAGWYTYPSYKKGLTVPTKFTFEGAEVAGEIEEPKPKTKAATEFIPEYDYHVGSFTMTVPVRLKKGATTINGKIEYQVCDPNVCLPGEVPFSFPLEVSGKATAPDDDEAPPIKVLGVKQGKSEVKVGEVFKVAVELEIPKGWHIYPTYKTGTWIPTEFKFPQVDIAGKIEEPKTKFQPKKEFTPAYEYHEGTITFTAPMRLKPGPKPGPLTVEGKVEYFICDPSTCIPADVSISFPLTVLEGEVAVVPEADPGQEGGAARTAAREFEEKGLGWLLGLSVLGGLISLIMPCVYPLIPITLTYFVKQAGVSRGKGFVLSSAYAVGIILTFTGLGFLLTILLGAQGAQIFASNPWVNLCIAAMFGVFALSLLGLFELQLPAFITNRASSGGPKSGVPGAFVLGLLFSVVSFTCTIPIAATILGIAASGEHAWAGLFAMLVYSGTMAVPFIFLGLFPAMIKELPKSGGWLRTVKVTAGFFEVALAAAYIWKADLVWGWGVFDRGLVLAIWIAVCFVIALYLFGQFRMKGDSENKEIGFIRIASAMLFVVLGFYLVGGVIGRPVGVFNVVLPPEQRGAIVASNGGSESGPKVYEDYAEAEKASREEAKPMFIEFTGVT